MISSLRKSLNRWLRRLRTQQPLPRVWLALHGEQIKSSTAQSPVAQVLTTPHPQILFVLRAKQTVFSDNAKANCRLVWPDKIVTNSELQGVKSGNIPAQISRRVRRIKTRLLPMILG